MIIYKLLITFFDLLHSLFFVDPDVLGCSESLLNILSLGKSLFFYVY